MTLPPALAFTTDVTRHERDFCLARVRDMVRIRRLEERCAQLYGEQKIRGFLHLYIGEEACAAGVMPARCSSLRPWPSSVLKRLSVSPASEK